MNASVTFPPAGPALKLARTATPTESWATTLAEERRRIQEDQDALREREANLREYEERLRSLQAEIEVVRGGTAPSTPRSSHPLPLRLPSRTPFSDDPALHAAWDKLLRAREILEAEQMHMRDDRISLRAHETAVKSREEAVTQREALATEREQLIAAATPAQRVAANGNTRSAMNRITSAPFELARSMFGGGK